MIERPFESPALGERTPFGDQWLQSIMVHPAMTMPVQMTCVYRRHAAPEFGSPEASPYKFYPGWVPRVNWKDEGWFSAPYEWWDRWELAGRALPVFEFLIRYRRPLDVGEFGVVGYAFAGVPASSARWTSDVNDLAARWGASWDLWGYGTGFGWYGDVPRLATEAWQRARAAARRPTPRTP